MRILLAVLAAWLAFGILPGGLALAGMDRDRARAALVAIGLRPDARAETLGPADWRALYGALKEGP